jgi:hypothetical protein
MDPTKVISSVSRLVEALEGAVDFSERSLTPLDLLFVKAQQNKTLTGLGSR